MEQALVILIAAVLLALAALMLWQFLNWRKTARCDAALERLFADVKERQALRTQRIMGCLTGQYHLNQRAAQELTAAFFSAEILFLTQLFELRTQQPVEALYQNLCDLLDSYLEAVPEPIAGADSSDGSAEDGGAKITSGSGK